MSEAETPSPSDAKQPRGVAEVGAEVCKHFYASTKLGGLWGYDGKVSREAITGLVAALREHSAAAGHTSLRVANEQVLINGQRLRMDFAGLLAFRFIVDLFVTRDIGEIRFGASASERDVVGLLKALNGVTRETDDPRGDVQKALARLGAAEVSVDAPRDLGDDDKLLGGMRDTGIQAYFRAAYVAWRVAADPRKSFDGRKAKRVVQDLADALDRDEATLCSLVQVKNFGDYRATRATNVAVLAMAVGRRLGMSKTLLAEVGLAGFLHEVDATEDDDDSAPALSRADRARGRARDLLNRMGYGDGSLRLLLATLRPREPAIGADARPTPLTHRILRVVDFYDAATTPAGPGRSAMPAHRVLRLMTRDPARFDLRVVKVLTAVVGRLPFGTVVRLDTGETAIVCGRNPHFDAPTRPIVKLLTDADGDALAEPKTFDLSTWDRDEERFSRSITEHCAPSEAYEKPADYLATI